MQGEFVHFGDAITFDMTHRTMKVVRCASMSKAGYDRAVEVLDDLVNVLSRTLGAMTVVMVVKEMKSW
jgi:hypothetical protein